MGLPRLLLTPGEPAGIGPDLALMLASQPLAASLVAVADPELLRDRAAQLNSKVHIQLLDQNSPPTPHQAGVLQVLPVPLRAPVTAGQLNADNADYVLDTLRLASQLCLSHDYDALVTAPVHKGIINDAGIAFSGHTEFLADMCAVDHVVMMLAAPGLRVALVTTHLPVRDISAAITPQRLRQCLAILHHDLQHRFALPTPRIAVCGLNPHAGEGGHLGGEEIKVIEPVLNECRDQGMQIDGPLPADTLFLPDRLPLYDAVLAMYHDQGLPVLKHVGFGQAVNVTLGLPIIRTSVDHGTALDVAGTGEADQGSLLAAIALAIQQVQDSQAIQGSVA